MGPSPAARRFEARLRLYMLLTRAIRGFDASDALTVACLALIGIGLALVAIPLALVVVGALIGLMTPIGTALRVFVRGR